MGDPARQPEEDREAAVREWEQHHHHSLVADGRKRTAGGIAMVAIAAAVLGAAGYIKHVSSESAKPAGNSELSIAERKPVPKLKVQEAAGVPVAPSAPAAPAAVATTPASATPGDDPMAAQREQMAMQRQEQARRMLEARMKSAIIAPNTNNPAPGVRGDAGQTHAGTLGTGGGAQDPNSRFARAVSGNGVAVSPAHQIDNLPYKILQGKLIEAVLEPRAISDLPGMVCATVQRDVYGAQGRHRLIPWGSRVCGVYSAEVRKGQDRLFVIWNTVRRPDGVEVALDSAGADQLGTAGMGGRVDRHFAEVFGMSALLSIIGAGAATVGVNPVDQYNSAAAYRQSVQQAAAQTSQSVLQPYINIAPTITVPAGSRVRIYVNKDLDFTPVYQADIDTTRDAARHGGVTFIQ
ncbi:type VI secretion protein (plasmid) [Pandoraea faecigallinarum]|uniref:Type VI secretion protein n=1 Tax=Pandoraea faecigallinarum TaxID=656179 RepID=A0A0H3WZH6_9BURK|nr:TrbI/VirB10 family protein [Pandoraea faecigallinarum]AKM33514.1 type VI secretion protein [Pandoraea faecigallinarum]